MNFFQECVIYKVETHLFDVFEFIWNNYAQFDQDWTIFFSHQKCSVQHRLLNVSLGVTVIDMKLKIHCWIFSNDIVPCQVYNMFRISILELYDIIFKVNVGYNWAMHNLNPHKLGAYWYSSQLYWMDFLFYKKCHFCEFVTWTIEQGKFVNLIFFLCASVLITFQMKYIRLLTW